MILECENLKNYSVTPTPPETVKHGRVVLVVIILSGFLPNY